MNTRADAGNEVSWRGADEEGRLDEYRTLVETIDHGVFAIDADGALVAVNDAISEMTGYPREDLLDEPAARVFGDDVDRIVRDTSGEPGTNGGRVGTVELEAHTADERRIPCELRIAPLRDGGERRGAIGTVRTAREASAHRRHRRAIDRVADPFYAVDDEFRVAYVNARAEELFDRSEGDLLGERPWNAVTATDIDEVEDAFRTAMRTQKPTHYDYYDGALDAWFEARLSPSETGVTVSVRDVTDRVERERELEQYETIIETVNDGIYVVDDDGRFTMVNDAYVALTGYSRAELLGSHASLVVDDETIERAQRVESELTEGTADKPVVEASIRTADGGSVPAEATFSLLAGDRLERVGVVRDVTDRRERERALEESERRYRTLAENFPNGAVGLFDDELTYTVAGGRLLDELDISVDAVVDASIFERYPADIVEEIEPYFRAVFDGESNSFETAYHGRELLAHTLPVRNADDEIYAGMLVIQDVTEREEYRKKLEASNERLEQFAYIASHDLQEPLRMVTSYLELLQRRYGDALDEDGEEFIAFAVDGAERMREMIDGLLEYSRIDTRGDPFEPVDLNDVLEAVLEDLQIRIVESGSEITSTELPRIEGDASQLRQVFQNLLNNAITYSGDDPPVIDISAERDGEQWVISVRDEGIGIDPDDTDRIFDVFQRLHSYEEHAGTGIGLALSQRIVERHGGEIWVDSEPGEETTVSFTLPAVAPPADG